MTPNVKVAEPLPGYKLRLQFANDEVRDFDTTPFLDKGIFVELKDEEYFNAVRVSFGSVEWPNEQDFSKDTLFLGGLRRFSRLMGLCVRRVEHLQQPEAKQNQGDRKNGFYEKNRQFTFHPNT